MPPLSSKMFFWLGWVFSILGVIPFFPSFYMKMTSDQKIIDGWLHIGWQAVPLTSVGMVEIFCVLVYLIPRTTVLGAILLTGYIGGVIATHVRVGDQNNVILAIILGVLIWAGLFLRDARVRALIPFRAK